MITISRKTGICCKRNRFFFPVLLSLLLSFAACGRKAPPVPPRFPDMTPVRAVKSVFQDGKLVLSWKPPAGRAGKVTEGYIVYRSTLETGAEECEGCPVVFVRVGELKRGTEVYRVELEKGYRYLFKVVAVSEKGTTGPDSEIVRIDY